MALCVSAFATVKPKITFLLNQSTSEMEEQVTLTCEASGDPTPTINWSFGLRTFTEGEQVRYSQPTERGQPGAVSHCRGTLRGCVSLKHGKVPLARFISTD